MQGLGEKYEFVVLSVWGDQQMLDVSLFDNGRARIDWTGFDNPDALSLVEEWIKNLVFKEDEDENPVRYRITR